MSVQENIMKWQKNKDKKLLGRIIKDLEPLVGSQITKYSGNLSIPILKSHAKRITIDALGTYNPNKAQVSTHVVNNLKRLHRVNLESSSTVRMSEELQSGVNIYKDAKDYLTDKRGREPSMSEIADYLGWSLSKVGRLERMLKTEVVSSKLEIDPSFTEMEDPRLDYVYHDLSPIDKTIFQHKIGYKGAPVLPAGQIAKKVRMSPATISVRSNKIAKILKSKLGIG